MINCLSFSKSLSFEIFIVIVVWYIFIVGANDVSMIQMADVDQDKPFILEVDASDFALGQFRFLKRLLLVHGRLNYRRMGSMVLYNFYRNAILVMLLFW